MSALPPGDLVITLIVNAGSLILAFIYGGRWLRNRLTTWVREPVRALETQVKELSRRVDKVERRQRHHRKRGNKDG